MMITKKQICRDILANCKVGGDTIAVDDSFSVKVPKNQADIVLIVEQIAQNEKLFKDLIPTLITDLREEFKQQGITYVSSLYNIFLSLLSRLLLIGTSISA